MTDTSWLERTELLIGNENIEKLSNTHVMVIGMGGVGSYAAEFLCRSGIGKMTIVDGDTIDNTNRNRQLPALATNLGADKVEVMAERLRHINPEMQLTVIKQFITPETADELMQIKPDYLVDAIDTIKPKVTLIKTAVQYGIKIASSMGAGGKLDPTKIEISDISKSYNCPFAYMVRKKLHKEKIYKGFQVCFSTEKPIEDSLMMTENTPYKKSAYGTISYIPAAFGGGVASIVIRDIIQTWVINHE